MGRPVARVAGLGVVIGAVVLFSPQAGAHERAGDATNIDSRIVSVPSMPDVEWWLDAGGRTLKVTNAGTTEILVLGSGGEPFLRVGPLGVHENLNSPESYFSSRSDIDRALPPRADPAAAPEWVRVSSVPRHAWHDRRVRWRGSEPRSGGELFLGSWEVPVVHEGRTFALRGEMWWVPGPPPWRAPAVGLALLMLVVAPSFRRGRDRVVCRVALCVVTVALLNLVHVADEIWARPTHPLDAAFGVFHTVLFVGSGIAGGWWSLRTRAGSIWALAGASAAVLLHQGLLQLPMLWSSSIPTIWPAELVRFLVGLSLAQAILVVFTVAYVGAGVRRSGSPESERPSASMLHEHTNATDARTRR